MADLQRFIKAQVDSYDTALQEIRCGCKMSHWIWYIFPQIEGLGHSGTSKYYAITGRDEAVAYLADETLGARLREITQALLDVEDRTAVQILGHTDALKVKSSMTLFDAVCPGDIFAQVLNKFYGGERCKFTLNHLNRVAEPESIEPEPIIDEPATVDPAQPTSASPTLWQRVKGIFGKK